ncbi:MAG: ParA family protein [Polyangiaceae bacterium]|nr:ParA family protein [Polyangiaceae bacterium]
MTSEDIRERIRLGLSGKGVEAEDVRVQPDPYAGWRIAVVSSGFEGMSQDARRRAVLSALPEIKVQWLDVLTPEERTWAGALPANVELEQLPLWPESLARGRLEAGQPQFPSDLDEDLSPPIVTTFYSLRGGVGRSTALAYTAHLLAARGKKVICVDLDLEAPGLAALFGKEAEVGADRGVVRLLLDLEQGARPDASKHLLRISEAHDLYCLPAGIPDADYARQLSLLDPEAWYREERNPLRDLMTLLAEELPFRPDVILLDSRTGITRLSGPLLFDLADLAFIVFFPHPQARKGTEGLVRALLASRTRRSDGGRALAPEPRFIVSPVPASKVPEIVQRYRHRAAEWIHDWLSQPGSPRSDRWVESEITHFIPYQEVLATSDQIFADADVWKTFQPLADWIQRFLPTVKEIQTATSTVPASKAAVLDQLEFPAGTAEDQSHLLETFVETDIVSSALAPAVPLVIGRKGTGKTAIFRWLRENSIQPITVLAPAKLREDWQLSADGFKRAEELLRGAGLEWRELWAAYVCVACYRQWPAETRDALVPPELRDRLAPDLSRELSVLETIEDMLAAPSGSLLMGDWLARLDQAAAPGRLLLLDGLDTGFGSAAAERERRTRAIEGLFTFLTDRGERLKNLRFKIMLREDIWKKLRFENKSHLFGKSVRLAWESQADYLTIVLRQALRSEAFRRLVPDDAERIANRPAPADAVFRIWNTLVGERMKGGNTAYTANWVWNRLADGNNDRVPRALLQLFQQATDWERKELRTSAYDRSILRPRALMESLDAVSTEALAALLLEEFSELEPLKQRLMELGRSPVPARDLDQLKDEVALAREVGLISVYEGTESDPIRYRVPDIYRIGLGMSRMGQL